MFISLDINDHHVKGVGSSIRTLLKQLLGCEAIQ